MAKPRSWWMLKKIRHRDAVALSVLSSSFLLAGEVSNQHIENLYTDYLAVHLQDPALFLLYVVLVVLAYTTYFGGILVLLGGIHFSWGRVSRGRFLLSLGVGLSFLALLKQFALATLQGSPFAVLLLFTTSLTGVGLLFGLASHMLMGEYALMLKKHAKTMWRRWRKARRPRRRGARVNSSRRITRS